MYNTNIKFIVRIPVIGGYTDNKENMDSIIRLVRKYENSIIAIEILKEHDLGLDKYRSLSAVDKRIHIPMYVGVSDEMLDEYRENILNALSSDISVSVLKV